MAQLFSTARQEIAKRAVQFIQGTATGGSTTTVIDANLLTYVDNYWNEAFTLFTSGTNNGLVRKVQTFSQSSTQTTLYSAVTAAVVSGDSYELYRRFSPQDIMNASNSALLKGYPHFYYHGRFTFTATQDTLTYVLPTGPDLVGGDSVLRVEYQKYTLAANADWPYQVLSPQLWDTTEIYSTTANATLKALQLNFNPQTNRLLRVVYAAPLQAVATGTDYVQLERPELEWFYAQAVTELWRIESSRSADIGRKDADGEASKWEATADKLRRQLQQTMPERPLKRTTFRTYTTLRYP